MTSAGAPASSGETILIVDDSDQVRMMLSLILTQQGYTVLEAESGAVALQIAGAHPGPIHLLICDLELPEMSGSQVAQALLVLRPDVRVLLISGHSSDAAARRGQIGRRQAFLAKPFSLDDLSNTVRGILGAPDGDASADGSPSGV